MTKTADIHYAIDPADGTISFLFYINGSVEPTEKWSTSTVSEGFELLYRDEAPYLTSQGYDIRYYCDGFFSIPAVSPVSRVTSTEDNVISVNFG